MKARGRAALLALAVLLSVGAASAESAAIDRAVVRYFVRETGGVTAPRFVLERELAFEARLEALTEGEALLDEPFRERHVRAALERHITETVLASLGTEPVATSRDVSRRMEEAKIALAERVGGLPAISAAARAEGISEGEVFQLLRRRALASLYLDRMVAPMLEPTDTELRAVHRTQRTPFSGRPFDEIAPSLRRWYVATRLAAAVSAYYDGLRTRLTVTVLH